MAYLLRRIVAQVLLHPPYHIASARPRPCLDCSRCQCESVTATAMQHQSSTAALTTDPTTPDPTTGSVATIMMFMSYQPHLIRQTLRPCLLMLSPKPQIRRSKNVVRPSCRLLCNYCLSLSNRRAHQQPRAAFRGGNLRRGEGW
jgi:hypothetical protein